MRRASICVCLLLAASLAFSQSTRPEKGKICGTVLDENGYPASNVHVIAMLISPGGHTGGYPGILTDASGRYCINGLPFGKYTLSGDDEGLGYPVRGSSFYSWRTPAPQVSLAPEQPDANLDWKIPFRAGFLYLNLPAAQSRGEIAPITIKLVARSGPRLGMMSVTTFPEIGKSKKITVLLPPREEILLHVSAAGNDSCPDDEDKGELLNVLPGAIEQISVGSNICYSAFRDKVAPTAQPLVPLPAPPSANHLSKQVGVVAPRLIHSVKAKYSAEALKAHYDGVCLVQLVVDTEGRPNDVWVLRPSGMDLDQSAIYAVMQYEFKPGSHGGRPAPMRISIAVPFRAF